MAPETGVVLITGVMASGKSTVAQRLAESLPRSVHVRGDVFRRFVVSGRVDPRPGMKQEAMDQLRLRYRLEASTADAYVAAGFATLLQDVVVGPMLAEVVATIRSRPRRVVVLDPVPAAVAAREAERAKTGYVGGWQAADLVAEFRRSTPRLGLWLDTTPLTAVETVAAIRDRWDEALAP